MPAEGRTKALKADLHMHTRHSSDSNISPEDILKQARLKGLDVVGVTDHNTTQGALETKKLAAKFFPGLVVLVGQEVRTNEGEIIVFGIGGRLPKKMPLEATLEDARKKGGFIIVPHPFDKIRGGIGKKNLQKVMNHVDAVEVLNSKSILKRFNKNAREFAEANKLPMVAGSDAHMQQYIGTCYTMIMSAPNEKEIYKAIRSGKTACMGHAVGLRGSGIIARMKKWIGG